MSTVPQPKQKAHLKLVPDPPVGVARSGVLPPWAVDLIRRGLEPAQLRKEKRWGVLKALGRTAASAMQHGFSYEQWRCFVAGEPGGQPSKLAHQYCASRIGRPHSPRELDAALKGIWRKQEKFVADHPPAYTERQIFGRLNEIRVAVQNSGLGPNDRAVLLAVVNIAEGKITLTPTAPRRALVVVSGLGDRTVRNGLERLVAKGWLMVVERGESRKPVTGVPGRAAIYRVRIPVGYEPET